MHANGLLADEQPLADLAVGPSAGDLGQHLAFARAKAERIAPRRCLRDACHALDDGRAIATVAAVAVLTADGTARADGDRTQR